MIAKIHRYTIDGISFIVFDGEVYVRQYPVDDESAALLPSGPAPVPEPEPTPEEKVPTTKKQKAPQKKESTRKVRVCSVCGKPGHNATTCTDRRKLPPDVFDEEEEDDGPKPNSTKAQMQQLSDQGCSFDEIVMSFPNVSMVVLKEMHNELTA